MVEGGGGESLSCMESCLNSEVCLMFVDCFFFAALAATQQSEGRSNRAKASGSVLLFWFQKACKAVSTFCKCLFSSTGRRAPGFEFYHISQRCSVGRR